jgi:hypothetical protein
VRRSKVNSNDDKPYSEERPAAVSFEFEEDTLLPSSATKDAVYKSVSDHLISEKGKQGDHC